MKSVAIIGGGITGLTAAFRLQKCQIPVTLYEAGCRVGGPIQTVRENGYLAECGPNTILETSPQISELVRELGLESHRIYSNPRANNRYIARNGRPARVPDSVGRFLSSHLFSAAAKVRLGCEPFISRSHPDQEESVSEFVTRRLGKEFLDYAINPMVGGVYAGDPCRLSVRHAFPKLHALEQRYGSLIAGQFLGARERKRQGRVSKQNAPKFSFDLGLELLTDTLHKALHNSVLLGHPITCIQRTACGWTVTLGLPGQLRAEEHSAVIVAIPAYDLARIKIVNVEIPNISALKKVYYPPVASIALGFRREDVQHPLDGFGVLVPEVERMNILGSIFSSSLFAGRAPNGHILLTSYLGGSRAPELALSSPEALIDYTLKDLGRLLGVTGKPTYQHCFVFRKAIPQYNVGYGRYIDLMARVERAAPGLLIGGHSRSGISLGDSITSGFEMAERTQRFLSDPWAAL